MRRVSRDTEGREGRDRGDGEPSLSRGCCSETAHPRGFQRAFASAELSTTRQ
jgi:hypothetical protein